MRQHFDGSRFQLATEDAAMAMGKPPRQLMHYAEKGYAEPTARPARGRGSSRRWSPSDLAYVYIADLFAANTSLSSQEIREFMQWLRQNQMVETNDRWAEYTFHPRESSDSSHDKPFSCHRWPIEVRIRLDLRIIRRTVAKFSRAAMLARRRQARLVPQVR